MKPNRAVIATLALVVLVVPFAPAFAAGTGIWKDTRCAATSASGGPVKPCDFCDALIVTTNITDYLVWFATIAAVLMVVVGALMMMFSAGSQEKFSTGKKTMVSAVVGLTIALAAWIVVNIIVQFLAPGGADVPWAQVRCS